MQVWRPNSFIFRGVGKSGDESFRGNPRFHAPCILVGLDFGSSMEVSNPRETYISLLDISACSYELEASVVQKQKPLIIE